MSPHDWPTIPSIISDQRLAPLTRPELARYHRNALVPQVGLVGQQRIRASRVLIVGAGGLGAPAALYLAAAGVGRLGIVDDDAVDLSNLQRQIIHTTAGLGRPKAESAARAVRALNPDIEALPQRLRLSAGNAAEILRGWDLVIDGTDNFPTRYLLSDATVLLGLPLVHGAVLGMHGQVGVFDARRGPCYRCLHPAPPPAGSVPSCAEAGVLGVLPGIIGTMQATEALKLIVGGARPLIGRLQLLDAWGSHVQQIRVARNPHCASCGPRPTINRLLPEADPCSPPGPAAGRGAAPEEISAAGLRAALAGPEPPALLDVREEAEVALEPMPGAAHIPLGEVARRAGELDPLRRTVVVCASGMRSQRAISALRQAGHGGPLLSLRGGMRAWAALEPAAPDRSGLG
ncbi:molybdopterin-synthase adenylyltransferase MoeB [Actinomyces bowdenii]|uniref:Molybdopterin-synthase adenylyltransferase MoeB n=1 Tax=Actinomyces bowdenii TaxID=131109 RepID=A0A3P1V9Y7_9ACTO|nr:molybdopterin-synthase adenylyltransferase MoeB [Actinomyces bowdenii]MBO3724618.1 molybdopterin-synthase adenylyltransferase MoeB [Actinomyces bowdenii]RRD30320.1 molybdopterin-synthase adenylyltransferase MoeB [Actinomyces bowdenii]